MNSGQTITYVDESGKEVSGKISGIRRQEIEGQERVCGYLVDTGKVLRTEVIVNDLAGVEINRRFSLEFKKLSDEEQKNYDWDKDYAAAFKRISKEKGIPKNTEERIDHHLIVDVLPENVRTR